MKKDKWLTAIVVFFAVLFSACEEDISNNYYLSDDLKKIGDFGVGSTWNYNVTFKDTVWFKYDGFYRDTFVVGDTIRFTDYEVIGKDTIVDVFGDTSVIDVINKIDTFRVVAKEVENIYGVEVPNVAFSVEEDITLSYTYPYGQGVTFTSDSSFYYLFDILKMTGVERQYYRDRFYFLQKADTFYVRVPYSVKKAFGPQQIKDIVKLTEVDESSLDYEMRNMSSSIENLKKTFTSSLWPKAEFIDRYYAASGGNEFYKRQVKAPTINQGRQDIITFNYTDGVLDTDFEEGGIGTYSIDTVKESMTIAGISFDEYYKVKSNVNNTINGILMVKDMEYWLVEGKGLMKIIDHTANAEWELESIELK